MSVWHCRRPMGAGRGRVPGVWGAVLSIAVLACGVRGEPRAADSDPLPLRRRIISRSMVSTEYRLREIWFAEQVARLQGVSRTPPQELPADDAPWIGESPWIDTGDTETVKALKARERRLRAVVITRVLERYSSRSTRGREAPEGLTVHPQMLAGLDKGWVIWDGDFEAPVSGRYRFAVHGLFGGLLELGGEPVTMVPFRHRRGRWDERVAGEVVLEAGLHRLRFSVQGVRERLLADVAVRLPESAAFQPLDGSFFPGLTQSVPEDAEPSSPVTVTCSVPSVLFDDEVLPARLVVTAASSRRLPVSARLWQEAAGGGIVVSNALDESLAPRPLPLFDPGLSAPSICVGLPLTGKQVSAGDRICWQVVSGTNTWADGVVVVRDLARMDAALMAEGTQEAPAGTLLRLSRPSLSARREWSLPKRIVSAIRPPREWLILADDFGLPPNRFHDALKRELQGRGWSGQTMAWPQAAWNGRTAAAVAEVLQQIDAGGCRGMLIIPPATPGRDGGAVRAGGRTLAGVLEAACGRLGREHVWVARPFPVPVADGLRADWVATIDRESGSYGVHQIVLDAWFQERAKWRQAYRLPDGTLSTHPVNAVEQISEFLIDELE